MNKTQKILLFIILIISINILTGCNNNSSNIIEDLKLDEFITIFKKEAGFFFSKENIDDNNIIASGYSPENYGNASINIEGNLEKNTVKSIHFTYYMPEDMSNPEGDHFYNSIYLNLVINNMPDFEKGKEWIYSNIQNIDNKEKLVDEEKIINNNHIHIKVAGEDHRKLELIIKNKNNK